MGKLEIILSIIIIFQWAYIFYFNYMYYKKEEEKKSPPRSIGTSIRNTLGIKTAAWIPNKDPNRILDGVTDEGSFD